MADYAQALTWHLVRDGLPRRGSMQALAQQVPGLAGAWRPCAGLAGRAPARGPPRARRPGGAKLRRAQSLRPEEQALLEFVASHVLTAVQRKQNQQDLEQAVQVSTAELAWPIRPWWPR